MKSHFNSFSLNIWIEVEVIINHISYQYVRDNDHVIQQVS